jgi:hypothetical protein
VKRFTIDGRGIRSFADFVAAVNLGLVQQVGGTWNGNLDAFNDYLSWSEEPEYEIELLGGENCASQLGHAAQAAWLRAHLCTCHPSNVADMQLRLARAEAGDGKTLFDVIREIVAANSHVHLVLR